MALPGGNGALRAVRAPSAISPWERPPAPPDPARGRSGGTVSNPESGGHGRLSATAETARAGARSGRWAGRGGRGRGHSGRDDRGWT